MKRARILVVDDEPHERHGLAELIAGWGYEVDAVADGVEALERLSRSFPGAVLTDIRMPRMDGLQLLARVRQQYGALPVLVLTGQGSKETVVECLRLRANDYIEKPIRGEELKQRLTDLLLLSEAHEAEAAAPPPAAAGGFVGGFVGTSAMAQEVRALVEQVAPTTASVLITGESGTGKEVVARLIHRLSPRRDRTFLAINCSAIPESLMESEIFGHEKGAFTGALERRAGCFELAESGTLLLDEIGEMPVATQAKLLRVLEDRHVRRLGSKHELAVNVRVLAATNRPPAESVASGQLRGDLYYRLNVFNLHLPPLREHLEDLPALCTALLDQLNQRHGRHVAQVSPEMMRRLQRHHWPGNVRELRNTLERALILAPNTAAAVLEPQHLASNFGTETTPPTASDDPGSVRVAVGTTVDEAERLLILKTLASENNNKTRSAERLGISLKTLQNKLKEYAARAASS
ncbi:MAG TPA: sigma-54 dependent transcriptional regulator [Terriglobales bacterium]|nr:sigma-54 dependent transcriptional regulator [Terriglobales bacterium]